MFEVVFLKDWRGYSEGDTALVTRRQVAKLERRGVARRVRRYPVADRMMRFAPMEK